MRTLHFGSVPPPAPGEKFDKSRWLKSAMPKREDRCPKAKKEMKGEKIYNKATADAIVAKEARNP